MFPRAVSIAVLTVGLPFVLSAVSTGQGVEGDTVSVQLLALNDFHGNLEPPVGSNGLVGSVVAGGAEYLATHLANLSKRNPNTLFVAAGDLVGASPLISGMFHDEPTVEALNAMGLDVSSTGNHEFDEGWRELLRLQQGGCHPVDGCQDKTPFTGASYRYLAANVVADPKKTGLSGPLLPAYTIKEIGGVRIGFIGLVLRQTPQLVSPPGIVGIRFRPEADAANAVVPALRREGVRAIVVLIHEGGFPIGDDYSGCSGLTGQILSIAHRMSDEIDVIVSGHTHRPYICTVDGKLVTSAASFGRVVTSIDLTIDKRSAQVVAKTARNVIVTRDVPKDPTQTAIIEHYRPLYTDVANHVVGTLASDLVRSGNAAGESALGNVIADGVLEAAWTAGVKAELAFMNPGGIRTDLARGDGPSGVPQSVTYMELSSVLPFRNRLVIRTMTGAMIKEVLEQQFDNISRGQDKILQVSRGFAYTYDRAAPKGRRVDPRSMVLDGRPVSLKQRYTVAINEFIAEGGDNFPGFTRAEDAGTIGMDLDALMAYFKKHSPVEAGAMNRITRVN